MAPASSTAAALMATVILSGSSQAFTPHPPVVLHHQLLRRQQQPQSQCLLEPDCTALRVSAMDQDQFQDQQTSVYTRKLKVRNEGLTKSPDWLVPRSSRAVPVAGTRFADDAAKPKSDFWRPTLDDLRQERMTVAVTSNKSDSIEKYIKSICNHEVLKNNEVVVLAREIQTLIKWEEKRANLELELMRSATYSEWAAAIDPELSVMDLKKQIRISMRAKSALVENNTRLVVSIAKNYMNLGLSFPDLTQEGIVGLSKATEKFDPERGFQFSTYATFWIKNSILRALAQTGRAIRLPVTIHEKLFKVRSHTRELKQELGRQPTQQEISKRSGITVEKLDFLEQISKPIESTDQEIRTSKLKGSAAGVGGAGGLSLLDVVGEMDETINNEKSYEMLQADVKELLCTLKPREQDVLRMRYGLEDGKFRTLEEIGKTLAVSRERIRQIEASALNKLRQPYRNRKVKNYLSKFA